MLSQPTILNHDDWSRVGIAIQKKLFWCYYTIVLYHGWEHQRRCTPCQGIDWPPDGPHGPYTEGTTVIGC
jgi:hypothetical protein